MPARAMGGGSEGGRNPSPRKSNATRTATKRSRCDGGNTCERAARWFERRLCRRERWGEVRKGGATPLRGNRMPRAPPQRGHAVTAGTRVNERRAGSSAGYAGASDGGRFGRGAQPLSEEIECHAHRHKEVTL